MSNIQATTKSAASTAAQDTIYGAERTKQEVGAASDATKGQTHAATGTVYGTAGGVAETAKSVAADVQAKAGAAVEQTKAAANNFANQASQQTNAAVEEGKHDVHSTQGPGYVDQAKHLAGSALGTAQSYVEAGQQRLAAATNHPTDPSHHPTTTESIVHTLQSGAAVALETTKSALASAQGYLQPHVDAAKETAAPYYDSASHNVQSGVDAAKPHVQAAKDTVVSTTQGTIDSAKQGFRDQANVVAQEASVHDYASKPQHNSADTTKLGAQHPQTIAKDAGVYGDTTKPTSTAGSKDAGVYGDVSKPPIDTTKAPAQPGAY